MTSTRRRHAVSIIEVLLGAAILGSLGASIQGNLIATVRGVSVDRTSEATRHLVVDLLERFCHPYSDIDAIWPADVRSPAVRTLTVDEAIGLVAIPAAEAETLKRVLASGGVTGFTLAWTRGVAYGAHSQHNALRLDKLWVLTVRSASAPGPRIDAFRVFAVRNG